MGKNAFWPGSARFDLASDLTMSEVKLSTNRIIPQVLVTLANAS